MELTGILPALFLIHHGHFQDGWYDSVKSVAILGNKKTEAQASTSFVLGCNKPNSISSDIKC